MSHAHLNATPRPSNEVRSPNVTLHTPAMAIAIVRSDGTNDVLSRGDGPDGTRPPYAAVPNKKRHFSMVAVCTVIPLNMVISPKRERRYRVYEEAPGSQAFALPPVVISPKTSIHGNMVTHRFNGRGLTTMLGSGVTAWSARRSPSRPAASGPRLSPTPRPCARPVAASTHSANGSPRPRPGQLFPGWLYIVYLCTRTHSPHHPPCRPFVSVAAKLRC